MLAYTLYILLAGYALFLLGFAVFMYFENQKFGDNQFTMKLLPPPPRLRAAVSAATADATATGSVARAEAPADDWSPVTAQSPSPAYRSTPSGSTYAKAA